VNVTPWPRILKGLFIACLALVGLYLLESAFEPFRTNWGDPWSDGNALTSGRHFAEEGFIKLAFTPRVDIGPITDTTLVYTHYPPLPDLVNGFLQWSTGGNHLAFYRIIAIFFSALSLYFFHAFVQRLMNGVVAKVAVAVMAVNLLWLQYADTLHHIPLYTMAGYATLAAAVRWLDERRPWQLACVSVATFFCFIASYDFYFYVPILLLGTIKLRKHRWFGGPGLIVILVVATSGLVSIAVKNLLAIWAVGSHEWYKDLVFQFLERSTSSYARSYKEGLAQMVFWRAWRFFTPLFYVCGFVQLVGVVDRLRGRRPDFPLLPLLFLAAGIPFISVFSQLFVEQYHTTLLLLPYASLSIATLLVGTWARSRVIALLLAAAYVGWQGFQLKIFKKTFVRPDDIAAISKALARDRHNYVLTNITVDSPSRYYWNRYAFGIITDPLTLRHQFEETGTDSALTTVQFKRLRRHAYDKWLYATFGGSRRWWWLSRPDFYRNQWGREFDKIDRDLDEQLADVGAVVHESAEVRVRQLTLEELDRMQRERIPRQPARLIDFETLASEPYKLAGFTSRQAGDESMPGYAFLRARAPGHEIFTLQGFKHLQTAPLVRESTLLVPIAPPSASEGPLTLRATISTPVVLPLGVQQTVTVKVNGQRIATRTFAWHDGIIVLEGPVPPEALAPTALAPTALAPTADGLQRVTFEYEHATSEYLAVRLHRLELIPAAPALPAALPAALPPAPPPT